MVCIAEMIVGARAQAAQDRAVARLRCPLCRGDIAVEEADRMVQMARERAEEERRNDERTQAAQDACVDATRLFVMLSA